MNENITIGITGAGGALGKSLTKKFKLEGYKIVGFSHKKLSKSKDQLGPDEWVVWECGKEFLLEKKLKKIESLSYKDKKSQFVCFLKELPKTSILNLCHHQYLGIHKLCHKQLSKKHLQDIDKKLNN